MIKEIIQNIQSLTANFASIPDTRKSLLQRISTYIKSKLKEDKTAQLVYICTHNSRRSHFGQIWGKVAAEYYGLPSIKTFSGGTEVTELNLNAIKALLEMGFHIKQGHDVINRHYEVFYDMEKLPLECFSKVYDDKIYNPQAEFCAIMTCDSADATCPFVAGAELRVATTYQDPKVADGTPIQDQVYVERCKQIATETLYVFANVIEK